MIQKNWTTTRFLRDAFENLSEKKKPLDSIVIDDLIWNQPEA